MKKIKKLYKSAFSDKQIIEIKKQMHIDPILTQKFVLKVCRNKKRIKFNCRPLQKIVCTAALQIVLLNL